MKPTLVVFALLLAGCGKDNPHFCDGKPDNNCHASGDGGAQGCTTAADCTDPATPVCAGQICVACADGMTGACGGATPVCSSHTCVACTAHGECASSACLPTGACGDDTTVAYAAPGGDDTGSCTLAAPCLRVTTAAGKGRPYVKIQGNLDEAVLLVDRTVTLLAERPTRITRGTVGPVIEIRGASNVVIQDLIVRDGAGTTGHGILVPSGEPATVVLERVAVLANGGVGVNVLGGALAMSRCVVAGNTAGGAIVSARFDIANSLVVANGGALSTTGGVTLTPAGTADVFRYNTVAHNLSSTNSASVRGINCTLPMTARSTIVAGNAASANCTFEHSLFDSGTTAGTNRIGDPKFKNVDALMPLADDFFRIHTDSAAVDAADPATIVATDIDGDARPMGNVPDIGADEAR